jgi:hypothetical protein
MHEVSRWDKKDDPIVGTASVIAERMKELGDLYKSNEAEDKSTLLKIGEDVGKKVQLFIQYGSTISTLCLDARLRDQIASSVARLPTVLQQLEITLAINATAEKADKADTEEQLEFCTKNLLLNIRTVLQVSEGAYIGNKFKADDLPKVPAKFQQVVYRKVKREHSSYSKLY